MAKGSIFFSNARGKVGNLVVSSIRGQEIWRAYQPNVTNPRTNPQTLQRIRFAEAVKFYKHAFTRFFRFAYEDKSKTESDYNAFMRHNISRGMVVTREQYKNDSYPALGYTYQLSQGSLGDVEVGIAVTTSNNDYAVVKLPSYAATSGTMGELSAALVSDYGLINGDVVTCVSISTAISKISDEPAEAPEWYIVQFFVNTEDETLITDYRDLQGHSLMAQTPGVLQFKIGLGSRACAGSLIFSRKTSSGLKASNSFLVNNQTATNILISAKATEWQNAALISWNAEGEAVLEGSLAKEEESAASYSFGEIVSGTLASPVSIEGTSRGSTCSFSGTVESGIKASMSGVIYVYAPNGLQIRGYNSTASNGSSGNASFATSAISIWKVEQGDGVWMVGFNVPAIAAVTANVGMYFDWTVLSEDGDSDTTGGWEVLLKV